MNPKPINTHKKVYKNYKFFKKRKVSEIEYEEDMEQNVLFDLDITSMILIAILIYVLTM